MKKICFKSLLSNVKHDAPQVDIDKDNEFQISIE